VQGGSAALLDGRPHVPGDDQAEQARQDGRDAVLHVDHWEPPWGPGTSGSGSLLADTVKYVTASAGGS
jgi:hypothetical protein